MTEPRVTHRFVQTTGWLGFEAILKTLTFDLDCTDAWE